MRLLHHAPPLSVVKLTPGTPIPSWSQSVGFWSLTSTPVEISIVCEAESVPAGTESSGPWVRLEVEGPLAHSMVGVLAQLVVPLADAGVSVFPIATYDTDHVLVRSDEAARAREVLSEAGHEVVEAGG